MTSRRSTAGTFAFGATVALAFAACGTRSAPTPQADIVFVCEHGAAKSVIAAEYFNRLAQERGLSIRAIARGADPPREPSTKAIAGLTADGFSPTHDAPRALERSDLHDASRVIVFDCHSPAMTALRGMDGCWDDTPDIGSGYDGTRDAVRRHVTELVDQIEHGSAPASAR